MAVTGVCVCKPESVSAANSDISSPTSALPSLKLGKWRILSVVFPHSSSAWFSPPWWSTSCVTPGDPPSCWRFPPSSPQHHRSTRSWTTRRRTRGEAAALPAPGGLSALLSWTWNWNLQLGVCARRLCGTSDCWISENWKCFSDFLCCAVMFETCSF